MATNPYVNKVNKADGTTIIDITDTTATASDVAQGKYFYLATGEKVQGSASGGAAIITDTTDANGGTIREITTSDEVYLQSSKSVTPTESAQTVEPDTGYDALESVTVGAISSTYVGSGITQRSSTDLSSSGATVTAPAGYYSSSASKSVSSMTLPTSASSSATSGYTSKATIGRSTSDQYINIPTGYNSAGAYYKVSAVADGTAGTPTATKGTVSNHAISVTPSVTNTTGYITGSTKTGTAVSVSASELVSGTLSITSSGTKDVTNYASASISAGTEGTPTATKGTVSNHSVSVTPSVTNTTGYISGGTHTGTAVTVSASELVSGTKSITSNGTGIDVVGYAAVDVNVSGGGGTWYGSNAERVNYYTATVALEDTDYAYWSPSTSQYTLWYYDTPNMVFDTDYDYFCITRFVFNPVYVSGTTLSAAPLKFVSVIRKGRVYAPVTISDWDGGTLAGYYDASTDVCYRLFYRSTGGVDLAAVNQPYGVYHTTQGGSFASDSNHWTATVYARCNASYFSTSMANAIDQANSTFTIKIEVYRVPRATSIDGGIVSEAMNVYTNGIS